MDRSTTKKKKRKQQQVETRKTIRFIFSFVTHVCLPALDLMELP